MNIVSLVLPLSHLSKCVSAVLEQHSDLLQSLSWKQDGSLLASSCKVTTTCIYIYIYGNDLHRFHL